MMKLSVQNSHPNEIGEFHTELTVSQEHTVSWRRNGRGLQIVRLGTHTSNRYLSFDIEEIACADGSQKSASKRTMVTLNKDDAAKVVAWIKEAFPDGV